MMTDTKNNILYTGTNPEHYKDLGNIIHFPTISIRKANMSEGQCQEMLEIFSKAELVMFTSRFGVEYFIKILEENDIDLADLQEKEIAVIGRETEKALLQYEITPNVVSKIETSQGMLDTVEENYDVIDMVILFPRSSLPNPYLTDELLNLGSCVSEFVVYENVKPAKRDLPSTDIHTVIFSSPSTVTNFLEDYSEIPKEWSIMARGEKTKEFLKSAGYESTALH